MATWNTLTLQDSSSPLMEQLNFFHDHTLLILILITILISYLMIKLFLNNLINRFLLHGQMIEMIWTLMPAITLIFIALPSLRLLYLLDEMTLPSLSLKTMGHQWYWSYEYSDFLKIEFESFMLPNKELKTSSFRLLDVDNRIILPYNTMIRLIVSSSDVLHSWTIPTLGVKIDAIPGRLNQTTLMMNRPGMFFGQCSEICGTNHSFMPIVIESIPSNYFIKWILNF